MRKGIMFIVIVIAIGFSTVRASAAGRVNVWRFFGLGWGAGYHAPPTYAGTLRPAPWYVKPPHPAPWYIRMNYPIPPDERELLEQEHAPAAEPVPSSPPATSRYLPGAQPGSLRVFHSSHPAASPAWQSTHPPTQHRW